MSDVYKKIVDTIKNKFETYDLAYTAFRSLCHSQGLCESLVKEIIDVYENISPSIAGNLPVGLPPCTECKSTDIKPGNFNINGKYWVQDLYCQSCHAKFARFNVIEKPESNSEG